MVKRMSNVSIFEEEELMLEERSQFRRRRQEEGDDDEWEDVDESEDDRALNRKYVPIDTPFVGENDRVEAFQYDQKELPVELLIAKLA